MKKTVSIILSLAIVFNILPALAAEDFILRNGIMFGDALDTVKAKEVTLLLEDQSIDATDRLWFRGTIAGIEGEARFDFDLTTGGLTDMLYVFSTNNVSLETARNNYSNLFEGLKRKYGQPLGNIGGTLHIITGLAFEHSLGMIVLLEAIDLGGGDIQDYSEWIVEANEYMVKIDLVRFYYTMGDETYYGVDLSYHYFTQEDLDSAIREKQQKNDIMESDL